MRFELNNEQVGLLSALVGDFRPTYDCETRNKVDRLLEILARREESEDCQALDLELYVLKDSDGLYFQGQVHANWGPLHSARVYNSLGSAKGLITYLNHGKPAKPHRLVIGDIIPAGEKDKEAVARRKRKEAIKQAEAERDQLVKELKRADRKLQTLYDKEQKNG